MTKTASTPAHSGPISPRVRLGAMPLIQAKLLSTPIVLALAVTAILVFSLLMTGTDSLANVVIGKTDPSEDRVLTIASPLYAAALSKSLEADDPVNQWLNEIGKKLVRALPGNSPFSYRFHVVRDDSVNAFALPGGEIFVHTGLLRLTSNPEHIAAVLAHEIVHVEHRHGLKHIFGGAGRFALYGMVFGIFGDSTTQMAGSLAIMKYGRDMETEADLAGARLLESAGLPRGAMVQMLNKFAEEGGLTLTWLSDHPDSRQRARRVANDAH